MIDRLLRRVEGLKNDREHGAAQICREGARVLLHCLEDPSCSRSVGALDRLVRSLIEAQPSMAPLVNLCNRVMLFVEAGETGKAIDLLIRVQQEDGLSAPGNMVERALSVLRDCRRMVVFSYSSTVISLLLKGGVRLPVLAHVGHPLGDGTKSARILADSGFEVTITSDLCLAGMLREGDLVLTGCDALLKDGVVNRAGTYPLALAARHKGLPFVVVTGEDKILPAELQPLHRVKYASPGELCLKGKYTVHHFYFETVPCQLVDRVITDRRDFPGNEIPAVVEGACEVSSLLLHLAGGV